MLYPTSTAFPLESCGVIVLVCVDAGPKTPPPQFGASKVACFKLLAGLVTTNKTKEWAAHDIGSTVAHSVALVGSLAYPVFHAAAERVIGAAELQVTTTDGVATDSAMVMFCVPTTPSAVAVTVAVPAPTPLSKPFASTVSTLVFDEVHVAVVAATLGPNEYATCAVNCLTVRFGYGVPIYSG